MAKHLGCRVTCRGIQYQGAAEGDLAGVVSASSLCMTCARLELEAATDELGCFKPLVYVMPVRKKS